MFLTFVAQYWYLFAMLAVIVFLLVLGPAGAATGTKKISALQLPQLQSRQNAAVLDVCNDDEFSKGHIESSIHIPLDKLEADIAKLKKYKDKPIILVVSKRQPCGQGSRNPA